MQRKSLRKEILRKFIHLMEVPALVAYTLIRHFFGARIGILALTGLLLVLLEIEYVRLEYKLKLPKDFDVIRKHERNNVVSSIFFVASTIIVFAAFDYPIAMTAMLLTVFGDLASALVGIRFGKHKIYRQKTLEGFWAGFLTNCLVGYLVLPGYPLIFFSMALVASVVELLTGKLDDNLTVPLFSAFAGQVLAYLLQAPLASFPGPIIGGVLKFFGL